MRRFVYLLLFIFAPGNASLSLSSDCGGKINVLRKRSGSIRYSLPSKLHPTRSTLNNITQKCMNKLLDVTSTWIIDAHENQTVWIDVISVGYGACLGITFGNEDKLTYEKEERVLFSGTGRTIIEWNLRRTMKTSGALHLRWNTSEDSHVLALRPSTHSDTDSVSPFPSGSNSVTFTPDIPSPGNVAPITYTLRGESVWQGEGVSDLADKSRSHFPQENTNNGQETAGAWISDLIHTGTHSYSDTHIGADTNPAPKTHINTFTALSYKTSLALSFTEIQSSLLSLHTTPSQATDITGKTSTVLDTSDVTHIELHTGSSEHTDSHTFTKTQSSTVRGKRGDPQSSMFPTARFPSIRPGNRDTNQGPLSKTSKQTDFLSDIPNKDQHEVTTVMVPNMFRIIERIEKSLFHQNTLGITHDNRPIASEMDRTDHFPRSAHPNRNINNQTHSTIYSDSEMVSSTPAAVSELPDVNQTNPIMFSDNDATVYSGYSKSFDSTSGKTEIPINVTILSATEKDPTTSDRTPAESTSTPEGDTKPSLFRSGCGNRTCTSYLPSTERQDEERQESPITTPPSIPSSSSTNPQINPNVTTDIMFEGIFAVRLKNYTEDEELEMSSSEVHTYSPTNSPPLTVESPMHSLAPQYSPTPSENTQSDFRFSTVIIDQASSGQTVDVSNSSPTSSSVTTFSSFKTTLGLAPFNDIHTGSMENTESFTSQTTGTAVTLSPSSADITSNYISNRSAVRVSDNAVQPTSHVSMTTSHWDTRQTTSQPTMSPHATSTENPRVRLRTHTPLPQPNTIRPSKHTTTSSYLTQTMLSHTVSTHSITQTQSWIQSTASSSDRLWPHRRQFFIVEDQPAIIKDKTFQVLLQVILEENFAPSMRLLEMESFLQRVAGYQSQHVTWHRGPVLQTVVRFETVEALAWLGKMESLLHGAGLNPLPKKGLFVGGVRVKNITVGGFHSDVCDWLFECPSGFQCFSSKGNVTCRSVCYSDYCKHQGICVHRHGQQPVCQCPVGEDYWFMGQRCDLRMTRPRLVGVCFGVLIAVAAVMALLSYLAVRRFKTMLMQAKVEQTRSSYHRFNHFDELSARFWGKSWPGSEDSLDKPVFTHTDELLHLRALDRTCCYHDDTLSVVSTYHGSGTHLNTVYPHSSEYGWDLSNCSLADCVVDSGKASDLSVCSWPIEPIQWTPFPLLQQLNRNTNTVKASRPHSYCEGMELVDLEKSRTA
ncbi:mucin-3A-like [Xyrauchen texanus]|uniref:mucin-3A-like n=1 Tax=Xyrauchen texanus TaxID=154827 RepID=UPI002242BA30|nr:mucin-3A-like [Xyrauchen texanus]